MKKFIKRLSKYIFSAMITLAAAMLLLPGAALSAEAAGSAASGGLVMVDGYTVAKLLIIPFCILIVVLVFAMRRIFKNI